MTGDTVGIAFVGAARSQKCMAAEIAAASSSFATNDPISDPWTVLDKNLGTNSSVQLLLE
jgi:hypothetical protein